MNDKELMKKIDDVARDYSGDIGYLCEAVGMLVIGRLFGWRVMRLAIGRRVWTDATRLFGDPKVLMEEKGVYYSKSVGASIVDKAGNYWEVVKRHQAMSVHEKRVIE